MPYRVPDSKKKTDSSLHDIVVYRLLKGKIMSNSHRIYTHRSKLNTKIECDMLIGYQELIETY